MGIRTTLIGVTIDKKAILRRAKPALEKEIENLSEKFSATIRSPIFAWNRSTKRKFTGEVVTSPRDIVDSAQFVKSLRVVWVSEFEAHMIWDKPYAKTIFYGTPTKPSRDFLTPTINSNPYLYFKKERNFVIGS